MTAVKCTQFFLNNTHTFTFIMLYTEYFTCQGCSGYISYYQVIFATVFWKTDHLRTRTEIHLCLYMIAKLVHYSETPVPITRQYIARSGFTDGFLPKLLSREGAFHGPGGHCMWILSVYVTYWRLSNALWVCLWLLTLPPRHRDIKGTQKPAVLK